MMFTLICPARRPTAAQHRATIVFLRQHFADLVRIYDRQVVNRKTFLFMPKIVNGG